MPDGTIHRITAPSEEMIEVVEQVAIRLKYSPGIEPMSRMSTYEAFDLAWRFCCCTVEYAHPDEVPDEME